jgi:pyruvate/2-oxoacid:ferredoxin oxidoreductase alpha subunit
MAECMLFDGNRAVAEGVRLASPGVIAVYPITPQTPVTTHLSEFIEQGTLDCRNVQVESEHSALSVCSGASATGVRTFTATSSQGLAYMFEMIYMVSGQRLPIVMYVVNRSLAMPTTLQSEHNDALSTRDSGWIQFHCESAQELLDTTIQAYRIAEDSRVLLPVLFCADGFLVSHTAERVEVPDGALVSRFLPPYAPKHIFLDPKKPMFVGVAAREMNLTEYRYNMGRAMDAALELIEHVGQEFGSIFGRRYGLIECHRADDAEYLFITLGSMSGTARMAVDVLRGRGIRAGLVKLRTIRPFPAEALYGTARRCRAIAVVERSTSIGSPQGSGCLFPEIASVFFGRPTQPVLRAYVAGLAARHVGVQDFEDICADLKQAAAPIAAGSAASPPGRARWVNLVTGKKKGDGVCEHDAGEIR